MVRIGPLSLEHQRRPRQMRRRAVGRVAMRAQMVLLSARGYTAPQIAEIFEVGEDVVRGWLHRFQERGPDGLEDRPRPGRPPKDRLARHIVDAQMHNGPRNSGLVQACWTVGLLASFLAPGSGWCCPPPACGVICMPAAGAGRGRAWTWPLMPHAASARWTRPPRSSCA